MLYNFYRYKLQKQLAYHIINYTKHTWSNEAIPASNCVRLTSSITSNLLMPDSGLYKISMAILTIPISTIFRARSVSCERFTRASAAGSDTSYIYISNQNYITPLHYSTNTKILTQLVILGTKSNTQIL